MLLPFKVDYNLVRKFTDPHLCTICSCENLTSLAIIFTASRRRNCNIASWAFNIKKWKPSEAEWCRAIQLIQSEEKERIEKFRYRDDMISSLIGRLFLRGFAAQTLGHNNNSKIRLIRTERGKPVLETLCGWDYNVSHAGDWVVFAAGESCQVGLDVMKMTDSRIDRLDEFFRIMDRQFTEAEWTCIRGERRNEEEQLARFFRNWTLKESYVKAIGTGLNVDLRSLNFIVVENLTPSGASISTTKLENCGELSSWSFEESVLNGDHVVCFAHNCDTDINVPEFEEMDISRIFGLFTTHCDIDSQLLRPTAMSDYQLFRSKDHPKTF